MTTDPGRLATSIRVLVVDDVLDLAESFAEALNEFEDVEVVGTAPNGVEAVRLTSTLEPDIVLMDIRMPVMDGIKATRLIARLESAAKVLMMTAYDDDSLVREAMDAGADGYLVKGTLVADTVRAIRAAVVPSVATG